jgi:hypothetical protein
MTASARTGDREAQTALFTLLDIGVEYEFAIYKTHAD